MDFKQGYTIDSNLTKQPDIIFREIDDSIFIYIHIYVYCKCTAIQYFFYFNCVN